MRISDLIIMGLKNLSRRKARTALTVVGVIIGTISIVVMISIGIGMNDNFKSQVMESGSLTIINVNKYASITNDKGEPIDSKEQEMDDSLVNQIKQIEHVKTVTPVINKSIVIQYGSFQNNVYITAMNYEAMKEFGLPNLTYGEYPSENNLDTIVLGSTVCDNFYNPSSRNYMPKKVDVTKQRVKLTFNSTEYPLKEGKKDKPAVWKDFAIMEQNDQYDYSSYMDINAFKKYYREYTKLLKPADRKKAASSLQKYEQIMINVDNMKNVDKVQDEIKALGFAPESPATYLKTMQETSNMLQLVLGGVGAVAMLVSAISIANTMVMSIYERTKEIGVMKVLGCVVLDIKKLFLFEAAMIGLIGGVIGIIISYILSMCINKFGAPVFQKLLSGSFMYNMENAKFSIIPIWLPLLAAGFAIAIGIISGYYPAKRATKISAIEAMKTES